MNVDDTILAVVLIAVTSIYTVSSVVLAMQAWHQRRDLSRADLSVRLVSPDGARYDVEVVNAGPGNATEVEVELRFLPDGGGDPARVARFDLPVLLTGEAVPTFQDEKTSRFVARAGSTSSKGAPGR
jgi:hypothetical protein